MRLENKGVRAPRLAGLALGAVCLALAAAGPALAAGSDVVATVNGKTITEADVSVLKELMGSALKKVPDANRRQMLVNILVQTQVLADVAEKAGLDQTPDFKRRLAWFRMQALRNAYVRKEVDSKITDADVKARYEEMVKQVKPKVEIRASHILVKSEAEAKQIIAQLDKGADFATLAKEKSIGPSKSHGGDLGFFGKGRMVPEFDKAAFALKVGEYSKQPVKTQFGWHVIKVVDERKVAPPTFDQVKEGLRQRMQAVELRKVVQDLESKAKIEMKQPAKQ